MAFKGTPRHKGPLKPGQEPFVPAAKRRKAEPSDAQKEQTGQLNAAELRALAVEKDSTPNEAPSVTPPVTVGATSSATDARTPATPPAATSDSRETSATPSKTENKPLPPRRRAGTVKIAGKKRSDNQQNDSVEEQSLSARAGEYLSQREPTAAEKKVHSFYVDMKARFDHKHKEDSESADSTDSNLAINAEDRADTTTVDGAAATPAGASMPTTNPALTDSEGLPSASSLNSANKTAEDALAELDIDSLSAKTPEKPEFTLIKTGAQLPKKPTDPTADNADNQTASTQAQKEITATQADQQYAEAPSHKDPMHEEVEALLAETVAAATGSPLVDKSENSSLSPLDSEPSGSGPRSTADNSIADSSAATSSAATSIATSGSTSSDSTTAKSLPADTTDASAAAETGTAEAGSANEAATAAEAAAGSPDATASEGSSATSDSASADTADAAATEGAAPVETEGSSDGTKLDAAQLKHDVAEKSRAALDVAGEKSKALIALLVEAFNFNPAAIAAFFKRNAKRIALVIALIAIVLGASYYPLRNYYAALREQERLQAEYQTNVDHNQALQSQIDKLQTLEGVEDEARRNQNMILPGEEAVKVTGVPNRPTKDDVERTRRMEKNSGRAHVTWWTKFLDFYFGLGDTSIDPNYKKHLERQKEEQEQEAAEKQKQEQIRQQKLKEQQEKLEQEKLEKQEKQNKKDKQNKNKDAAGEKDAASKKDQDAKGASSDQSGAGASQSDSAQSGDAKKTPEHPSMYD